MTAQKLEPELLVNDAHGIYVIQQFVKKYLSYIVNRCELQEDIDIVFDGPEHEDFYDAWANLLDKVQLTNDKGEKFTIGNLGDRGDLWAIPEGYEYPDEF